MVSRTTSRNLRGGGGVITEYANRHNTLFVMCYTENLLRSLEFGMIYVKFLKKVRIWRDIRKVSVQCIVVHQKVIDEFWIKRR
jgi:hypothetical protein